jgi:hypothetical protein
MKIFAFLLLLTFQFTSAAELVDFNSMSSFDSVFSQTLAGTASSLADGVGLRGSRGVAYTGSTAGDLHVYPGQLIHPNSATWQASIYFRNNDLFSQAEPMLGFMGQDSRYGGFVNPYFATAAIYVVAQPNTLWLFGSAGSFLTDVGIAPVYTQSEWYKLSLQIKYLGTVSSVINTYNIHASLFPSDASGNTGSAIAEIDHSLSTVQFQDVNDLYGFFGVDTPKYFGWNGPGFKGAMDNFAVSVPEPSSTFWLVTFCAMGLLHRRFRRTNVA